jgi:hypothetical protein
MRSISRVPLQSACRREPPGRLLVTDAELCEAIPESFATVGEAEYQDILDD